MDKTTATNLDKEDFLKLQGLIYELNKEVDTIAKEYGVKSVQINANSGEINREEVGNKKAGQVVEPVSKE